MECKNDKKQGSKYTDVKKKVLKDQDIKINENQFNNIIAINTCLGKLN